VSVSSVHGEGRCDGRPRRVVGVAATAGKDGAVAVEDKRMHLVTARDGQESLKDGGIVAVKLTRR